MIEALTIIITVHDEVIYGGKHSGFVSRVIAIDGDEAVCMPIIPNPEFRVKLALLRHVNTEGS